MKKQFLFIPVLFLAIICSTILVTTAISGLFRVFYKTEMEKTNNAKANSVSKELNEDIKQVSVKL
jgi:hypothetical protein